MLLSEAEIKSEIHDVTRQFFTRHKDEFTNWGDAMHWLHTAEYEVVKQEAASLGRSKLSTEIQWLVSLFGPLEKINWDVVNIRKVPALSPAPKILEDSEEEEAGTVAKAVENTQTPRRRLRRKRY